MQHIHPTCFRKTVRRKRSDDLLGVWLELLNHLDNPIRRRAAKLRQAQRPRRDIPVRGSAAADYRFGRAFNPRHDGLASRSRF
jgi:hypothetical protein